MHCRIYIGVPPFIETTFSLPLFRCNPSRKSCSAKVVASQRILVGAKQEHSVKPSWPSITIYLVPGSWARRLRRQSAESRSKCGPAQRANLNMSDGDPNGCTQKESAQHV